MNDNKSKDKSIPAVLTIAGSDSGGGAGIQADLRTFSHLNVYGCSAITAITAQNPLEVRLVSILSDELIKSQLDTVFSAFKINVIKTGMLPNENIVSIVANYIQERKLLAVIDPVMVSTSGVRLIDTKSIDKIKQELLYLATWITPNIPEAELISETKISSFDDTLKTAIKIFEKYNCNVILKCGHATWLDKAIDIVCYKGKLYLLTSPLLNIISNEAHGTGCTLSSAIAAGLAKGKTWEEAIIEAKAFVYGSLLEKVFLGKNFAQMYPPTSNYIDAISLEEYIPA